ncbi:hypothetical protein ACT4RV_10775, partial [Ornithobacterium rhinotracheale]
KIPAENIQGLNDMLSGIDLSSKVENADFERYKKEQVDAFKLKANADASNIGDDNKHLWKTALDIEETFTRQEKQKLENFPAVQTNGNVITFDCDRNYGTTKAPIETFTIDMEGAKIGTTVLINFNGSSLPRDSKIDWRGSIDFFIAGTNHVIYMTLLDNDKIHANLV